MQTSLLRKLETLIERRTELDGMLAVPAVINDQDRYRALSREHAEISPVVECFGSYRRTQDAISPKIAGEAKLVGGTLIQLSLAHATRFPTVGELFQGSLNGDGSFNANSFDPDLKAEKSYDLNALVSHDFGQIKLTGSYFFQRVDDTIFSFTGFNQNGVVTSSFKNIHRTRQMGVEIEA